jgi:formylglycine-generating enzyme required for sulfatase activity
MRSWLTAMPGETVSCVGCHEKQNSAPPMKTTIAATRRPSPIKPWYGPARGFSFEREVQPVLDRFCVGCHDGQTQHEGRAIADLTHRPDIHMQAANGTYNGGAHFSPSYFELRKFVRSPTLESDAHMLSPQEYHADTTKLVQLLQKGHHNVKLDDEAWDRLITWIDLHTPAHGTWAEVCGEKRVKAQWERRSAMRKLYTGIDDDPEAVYPYDGEPIEPIIPQLLSKPVSPNLNVPGWPFDKEEAAERQTAPAQTIELADGILLQLGHIPAGEFVMGDADGYADEQPLTRVKIARPFFLGTFEVTNEQFALFDPAHDSRLEGGDFLQFSTRERGYVVHSPKQPVLRVSWTRAMEFCAWLSQKTGRKFDLPTEGQWEYACRAGSATPLWYGDLDADFSPYANVSDATHQSLDTFGFGLPSGAIPPWRPADVRFNDKHRVSAPVGAFAPNAWGLHDMHGNVAEWTRSVYRSYPYDESDIHDRATTEGKKVVRGGSWYDRPKRCRSGYRWGYPADQTVFDVGFRVMCDATEEQVVDATGR